MKNVKDVYRHYKTLSITRKYVNPKNDLQNTEFWKIQATELAKEFGFDHYNHMLEADSFGIIRHSDSNFWFDISDDDVDDNEFYNGIELVQKDGWVWMTISQYVN